MDFQKGNHDGNILELFEDGTNRDDRGEEVDVVYLVTQGGTESLICRW